MSDIHTEHILEQGEQVTIRTVTVTDAAGQQFEHEFRVNTFEGGNDPKAHEYLGTGEPPESAVDKLREFLTEPESTDE